PFPEHAHATITQARPVEGMAYSVFLHPKQDVSLQRLEMQFDLPLPAEARMLANGYQSWSETRKLRVSDGIPRLLRLAGAHMGLYGDEHIPGIPRGKGRLHSWTYTLIEPDPAPRSAFPPVWLVGSRNERTGFTLMLYDWKQGILTVRKDLEGLELSHSFPALDFVALHGAEALLYEAYFQQLGIEPPAAPPAIGWTSWYRHSTRISEETALHNLAAFAACREELRQTPLAAATEAAYFQIDDGWQTQVGDWLSAKPDFPKGMAALAAGIRREGLWPGLWLAPFVASRHSDLARRHPDWLLKDAQGRPLRAGWNPLWGGWYYALDFYCPAVQEYLAGVFHVVCEKWGYELLKLDFLFAAALRPPKGKTRGQVMAEVIEFLRRQVGRRRILACGVPLGCCFGTVEYCRIGGDVHMAWSHPLLRLLRHRERVDTWSSLRSTLSRWPLGGRAFHNDPDVFMLRADHQRLSPTQQYTLLTINALLGGLLFTSDDV
ncbi:MAG TPA: alpha-galactosidase, partial [Saprospiraceae bacterium]|nr:alpha-galactosidase [Saprospiraceae bacterium]